MQPKTNKIDYEVGKSYRVIILLKSLRKVRKTIKTEIVTDWCEVHHMLQRGPMGFRRQQSKINVVARVIQRVQEASEKGVLAGILLIDVRRTFDHISRNCPMLKMETLGVNKDLVKWT